MVITNRVRAILLLVGVFCCSSAVAGWSLFGSHKELEGYSIIGVGEVSEKHWYDPETLQRLEWFEFTTYRTQCFLFSDQDYQTLDYSEVPSLLLKKVIAGEEIIKVALLEPSFHSLSVNVRAIKFVLCPKFT